MDSIVSGKGRALTIGWIVAAVQLGATLLILALDTASVLKLLAFIAAWGLTFRRWSLREWFCYLAVCSLFSVMDILAVRQGLFVFSHPDFGGLPTWEYFMWGFYVLHLVRTLDGPAPLPRWRLVVPLAILFAFPFAVVAQPLVLLAASGAILAIALLFFHEAQDIRYAAYAMLLGAAVEYVGVWSGQWQYPRHPPGGVELWFVTMWGGIGLFTRRLVLPLIVERRG